jgi:hypothetical protein
VASNSIAVAGNYRSAVGASFSAPRGWIDSLIVPDFPPLFEQLRAKRFNLLWRGSRDGFAAQEFHYRCHDRANTLTVVSDTDGNVFGGFTRVKWESRKSHLSKGDDSRRSFLFTLRNPPGVPPQKFVLKAEEKQYVIYCHSAHSAAFGYNNGWWDSVVPRTATQTETVAPASALTGVTARTRTIPPSRTSSRARRSST